MLQNNVNRVLSRITNLIFVFLLMSCVAKNISAPVIIQSSPTPLPNATVPQSQILPTNIHQKLDDPVENKCVETMAFEQSLPNVKGVLLGYTVGDRYAPFLFNLSNGNKKELQLESGTTPLDFIISPDRKSVALSVSTTVPPVKTTKILIVNAEGATQKEFAWKSEWGRIASWSGDQHILIAKLVDLQLSIYNPKTIISLDVNSGLDIEINSTYPGYNQVNYVNWNLINYVYSPDFTQVLYPISKVDPGFVNYVALWDMKNKQALAMLPVELSETSLPEWSPDRTRVLIAGLVSKTGEKSSGWPGQELFTIGVNGNITQLTHFTDYYPTHITIDHYTWSPDGKNVAFWLQVGQLQVPQLVVLDVDSGNVINYCISALPHNTSRPIWSPSSDFLVIDYQLAVNDVSRSMLINISQETIAPIADNVHVVDWLDSP